MLAARAPERIVILLLSLTTVGCSAGNSVADAKRLEEETLSSSRSGATGSKNGKEITSMIDPSQAREALLKLIERSKKKEYPVLRREGSVVKNSPMRTTEPSVFFIGNWCIDRKELTFTVTFDGPPLMLEYTGAFKNDAQENWIAVITRTRQTPVQLPH